MGTIMSTFFNGFDQLWPGLLMLVVMGAIVIYTIIRH